MNDLIGQPGEVMFTLTVTRKETGLVETYPMVGRIEQVEPAAPDAAPHLEGEPA